MSLHLDQVQERLHSIRRARLDTLEEEPSTCPDQEDAVTEIQTVSVDNIVAEVKTSAEVLASEGIAAEEAVVAKVSEEVEGTVEEETVVEEKPSAPVQFSCTDIRYRHLSPAQVPGVETTYSATAAEEEKDEDTTVQDTVEDILDTVTEDNTVKDTVEDILDAVTEDNTVKNTVEDILAMAVDTMDSGSVPVPAPVPGEKYFSWM